MIDAAVEKRIYSPPPVRVKPPVPKPNPPDSHIHHGQYHGRQSQPVHHPHFPDDHRHGRFPGDPGHYPEHVRGNGGNPMNSDYHPPSMGHDEPIYHGRNRRPSHESAHHPYHPGKPAIHPRDNLPPPPDVGAAYHSQGRDHYHHSGQPIQPRFPDTNPRDRYGQAQRYPPSHGHFPDDPYAGHRGPPNRGPPSGHGRFPPSRDSDNRFRPY